MSKLQTISFIKYTKISEMMPFTATEHASATQKLTELPKITHYTEVSKQWIDEYLT
jgi:hypothetical protein